MGPHYYSGSCAWPVMVSLPSERSDTRKRVQRDSSAMPRRDAFNTVQLSLQDEKRNGICTEFGVRLDRSPKRDTNGYKQNGGRVCD